MFRVLLAFLTVALIAQNRLSPQEERGKQIFEFGTSASGSSIEALIAEDSRVPGSIVPCANCHGHDGQGKPEGGVVPSNITWDALTKPYGLVHPDGRTHTPYTERLLRRAITMGVDPGGNSLSDAMPRFQLSLADASDLVAFIKRLGEAVDPGLSAEKTRLGVILPPSQTATAGRIVRQALLGYFERVNSAGGIFNRRIELAFAELPSDPAHRADAVRDFISNENIFALVSATFAGAESAIAAVISKTGTPAVAAFAPFPQTADPLNRYVFYLDGGVREEVSALLGFIAGKFPAKDFHVTIASWNDETVHETAGWLQEHLAASESGYRQVTVSENLQPIRGGLVFWLRPNLEGLAAVGGKDGQSVLLIPGSLLASSSATFPTAGNSQVFIALGTASLTQDETPDRIIWDRATASAAIIAEGMSRAGRNLTRQTLLNALEGLYSFQTNLPMPFTFGPSRRIGANNVRIVMLDTQSRKFIPAQSDDRAR